MRVINRNLRDNHLRSPPEVLSNDESNQKNTDFLQFNSGGLKNARRAENWIRIVIKKEMPRIFCQRNCKVVNNFWIIVRAFGIRW